MSTRHPNAREERDRERILVVLTAAAGRWAISGGRLCQPPASLALRQLRRLVHADAGSKGVNERVLVALAGAAMVAGLTLVRARAHVAGTVFVAESDAAILSVRD
jgi:hypothetical protein